MRTPAVQVSEPGRSPLTLLITEDLDIGRDCNGLILLDASISRRHLSVCPGGASVLVADLSSLNGSTVDGRPIIKPHRLAAGEVVRFGGCTLTLATTSADTAPHSASGGAMLAGPLHGDARTTSIDLVAAAVLDLGTAGVKGSDAGTVTVVFSEIMESTARVSEVGDLRWHQMLAVHNQIMSRMLARQRGSETHLLCDGFMTSFGSARVALAFVIDVQRALAAYEAANPLAGLSVRAGVHTGEVVLGNDDVFGRHVVMAACGADQARGGEILVSSVVREIVEPRGDVVFGESRTAVLKGLAGEHLLHRVVW